MPFSARSNSGVGVRAGAMPLCGAVLAVLLPAVLPLRLVLPAVLPLRPVALPHVHLARAPHPVLRAEDAAAKPASPQHPPPTALSTWLPIGLAAATSGAILVRAPFDSMPRLLVLHLCGVTPLVPLGIAGRVLVLRRLRLPATQPPASATEKKARATWLVRLHAACSVVAFALTAAGVASIYLNKVAAGKPHLTSLHGRLGAATIACWVGAYAMAQRQIWRDVWRSLARDGSLVFKIRYLWACVSHRRLGNAAICLSLAATATGVNSKWGRSALGLPFVAGTWGALLAVGILTFLSPAAAAAELSRRRKAR
jgi:uncharacterized membrane protein YozB (DUF420 family)